MVFRGYQTGFVALQEARQKSVTPRAFSLQVCPFQRGFKRWVIRSAKGAAPKSQSARSAKRLHRAAASGPHSAPPDISPPALQECQDARPVVALLISRRPAWLPRAKEC